MTYKAACFLILATVCLLFGIVSERLLIRYDLPEKPPQ